MMMMMMMMMMVMICLVCLDMSGEYFLLFGAVEKQDGYGKMGEFENLA